MPKIIKCHPDWELNLIKIAIKSGIESFLNELRGKRFFKFIGNQSSVEDTASNIFQITSGKQFTGSFQIIDDPSEGKILKIEYEKSGKKAKSLLWDSIFDLLESNLNNSPTEVANK